MKRTLTLPALNMTAGRLDGSRSGSSTKKGRSVDFVHRLRRFGPLPDWAREHLAAATSEQLDRWAERVLDAASLREVLAE